MHRGGVSTGYPSGPTPVSRVLSIRGRPGSTGPWRFDTLTEPRFLVLGTACGEVLLARRVWNTPAQLGKRILDSASISIVRPGRQPHFTRSHQSKRRPRRVAFSSTARLDVALRGDPCSVHFQVSTYHVAQGESSTLAQPPLARGMIFEYSFVPFRPCFPLMAVRAGDRRAGRWPGPAGKGDYRAPERLFLASHHSPWFSSRLEEMLELVGVVRVGKMLVLLRNKTGPSRIDLGTAVKGTALLEHIFTLG